MILALSEPLVEAMVVLLKQNLAGNIDLINAAVADGVKIDHAAQVLDYVPPPSALEGGMPAIGVQDLPAEFRDDLQNSVDADHQYAVVATLQNADHGTLVHQLRRTIRAIAMTIQNDRVSPTSILRTQGGAWSVRFLRTVPGPLLGDIDPVTPEAPPRSYVSWVALELASRRQEVG